MDGITLVYQTLNIRGDKEELQYLINLFKKSLEENNKEYAKLTIQMRHSDCILTLTPEILEEVGVSDNSEKSNV